MYIELGVPRCTFYIHSIIVYTHNNFSWIKILINASLCINYLDIMSQPKMEKDYAVGLCLGTLFSKSMVWDIS